MLQHGCNIQHKETVSLPGWITPLTEPLKATGQHMPGETNANQVTHTAGKREELKDPTVVSLWKEEVVPLTDACKHTQDLSVQVLRNTNTRVLTRTRS